MNDSIELKLVTEDEAECLHRRKRTIASTP